MGKKKADGLIEVAPPDFRAVQVVLRGTAPLVLQRFGEKAKRMMMERQQNPALRKLKPEARDFEKDYQEAAYISEEGWYGVPANALRSALIEGAYRSGLKSKQDLKVAVFVVPQGTEARDGTPLLRVEGEPRPDIRPLRNDMGSTDLRVRVWFADWTLRPTILYDASLITVESILNALVRAGRQIGIGEGRPMSRRSYGVGWGLFELADEPVLLEAPR